MLKRLSQRDKFELLIAQYEPVIRKAFMDAVDDIHTNADLRRLVKRLERGDIAGAVDALNIDAAAFRPVDRALAAAFEGAGIAAVSGMPSLALKASFSTSSHWLSIKSRSPFRLPKWCFYRHLGTLYARA